MNHSRTAIASGLLAFALIAPAHAERLEASALASLTNITITLQDDKPLDGISPSILWTSPGSGTTSTPYTFESTASIITLDASGHAVKTKDAKLAPANGTNIFTTTSTSVSDGTDTSQSWIAPNAIGSQVHATLGQSGKPNNQQKTSQAAVSPSLWQFVLSPHTRITITGTYATSVATNEADIHAFGSVRADLWLENAPYNAYRSMSHRSIHDNPNDSFADVSDMTPKNGTFTLTLLNAASNPTGGGLILGVMSYASLGSFPTAPSNLPEPETIALMLAGLGVVVGTRRRQRH